MLSKQVEYLGLDLGEAEVDHVNVESSECRRFFKTTKLNEITQGKQRS